MKRFFITILVLIILAAAGAGAAAFMLERWFKGPGPLPEDVVVFIEPGTGFSAIAEILASHQVIDDPLKFKLMALWTKDQSKAKAGEYLFPSHMSPSAVLQVLVKGESITHAVTIPEGLTVREIALLLMSDKRLTGAVPATLKDGSVMPSTYYIHRGDSREALIDRMQREMQQAGAELWQKRQENLPVTTLAEALVLASVVEKETGLPEERGRVAAVFVNRLRKGMPLQSDPTVVYGIELANNAPLGRALTHADLAIDHPFNTYVHKGLPPSPICNPGRASLEAVLNPPQTDEYYFVATGTGGHNFSKTIQEHNQNVTRYRAVLRQQKQP